MWNGLRLRNSTSVSPLSIGRADCESGSLISSLICSVTKLTHIMKNISSCNTTSSSGVRLGSMEGPSDGPWLIAIPSLIRTLFSGEPQRPRAAVACGSPLNDPNASLLLPDRRRRDAAVVGDGWRLHGCWGPDRLRRVVGNLPQQVVGAVA